VNRSIGEDLPPGWGDDPVTRYLNDYRGNQFATFANKRREIGDLIKIDGLLRRLVDGAIDPKPRRPMFFLLRSHAAFLAALGATMAGQVNEAQALLRLCLEHANYGFYIGPDVPRWERWMARNDNEASKKVVLKEFHASRLKEALVAKAPEIGKRYVMLYERLIDFGAHPNEQGYSISSSIDKTEDGTTHLNTIYLHPDGLPLAMAMKTASQVGICALLIAQMIYPGRFELLRIRDDLDVLRTRY
jgi:hypothetical protein